MPLKFDKKNVPDAKSARLPVPPGTNRYLIRRKRESRYAMNMKRQA